MDISKNMEVVDANDQHVGIVDMVEGDHIKLEKEMALDPRQLTIAKSEVERVEGNKVYLSRSASAITTRAFVSDK